MTDSRIEALRMILLALDEVQHREGLLPSGDPEGNEAAPLTFLDLVKQYAGNRVPEPELVVAVEAVAPLFPSYQFSWK
ncbi:hypothetical protein VQ574_21600 (plasmid) [Stutzerimonas frequens]|uniref:hypothetical protein n=1 Tax=Stutzerimonas frequens TaxID=2968969 RepID=UPI002DBC4310|nr:hypothetical protein [Stutzerimonas frequens]WRW29323.1 hypothetical protein VQ574_21600 [Stutzerimonas frequens]